MCTGTCCIFFNTCINIIINTFLQISNKLSGYVKHILRILVHFTYFKPIVFPLHETDSLMIVQGEGYKLLFLPLDATAMGGGGQYANTQQSLNTRKDCILTEYFT
jgi:hypothetical protein